MMPELENLIQKRAHEIWEQEGRPHGRHEDHWRQAAEEVTREIERLKSDHQAESAQGGEAAPKRQRRTKAAGEAPAPRARKSTKAAEDGASTDQAKAPARRRATKDTGGGGAQAEPAAAPARTTRRRTAKTEGA